MNFKKVILMFFIFFMGTLSIAAEAMPPMNKVTSCADFGLKTQDKSQGSEEAVAASMLECYSTLQEFYINLINECDYLLGRSNVGQGDHVNSGELDVALTNPDYYVNIFFYPYDNTISNYSAIYGEIRQNFVNEVRLSTTAKGKVSKIYLLALTSLRLNNISYNGNYNTFKDKNKSNEIDKLDGDYEMVLQRSKDRYSGFCDYLNNHEGIEYYIKQALLILSFGSLGLGIILSIIDFIKAIASKDDAGLTKAFGVVVKRIIAVVLIFSTTLIVTFILNITPIPGADPEMVICDQLFDNNILG